MILHPLSPVLWFGSSVSKRETEVKYTLMFFLHGDAAVTILNFVALAFMTQAQVYPYGILN
ncbi:hypothetical protein DSM107007_46340 [Nostoc sp. PCC 7120 = FACHB-418]|nr:hypothetical protein DSM107007_46340 [Nostoc sp. PCC 7120 = FACHB-418]